jgi:hypothetical protein
MKTANKSVTVFSAPASFLTAELLTEKKVDLFFYFFSDEVVGSKST